MPDNEIESKGNQPLSNSMLHGFRVEVAMHLSSSLLISTFLVKGLFLWSAVKDVLITSHLLSDVVQSLNEKNAEMLSALIGSNYDILNVALNSEVI